MIYDNRLSLRRGRLHLSFTIAGKRIAYAYIRKNACSAFKNMLLGQPNININELANHFPFQNCQHDAAIFIWRDPIERMVSLYRNKIVEQRNAKDFLAKYRAEMRSEPAGFDEFVRFACMERDPHCFSQKSHLRRMLYTHAIFIEDLGDVMRSIIGPEADLHFATPVNKTSKEPVLVSEAARRKIRTHYAEDYRMIKRIRRARQLEPSI